MTRTTKVTPICTIGAPERPVIALVDHSPADRNLAYSSEQVPVVSIVCLSEPVNNLKEL